MKELAALLAGNVVVLGASFGALHKWPTEKCRILVKIGATVWLLMLSGTFWAYVWRLP